MTTWMGVHSCCVEEIREDESRPCKSKEMDAEGVDGDQVIERFNEECEKDWCGCVDEELSEMK